MTDTELKNKKWLWILFLPVLAFTTDDRPELRHKETIDLANRLEVIPDGGATGEQQAWNLNWYLGPVLRRCDSATDDWLEPAERILNILADKMAVGPDGYKGFIGPYIYNEKEHWCDVHVGDAILIKHVLHFAVIIHQNPRLKAKYGKSADRFVQIGKRDLIEKWEKRGTYIVDGPFAGYSEWNMFCKPNDIGGEWYVNDNGRGEGVVFPSLPFNKALDMAYVRPLKGGKEFPVTVQQMGNGIQLFYVWDGTIDGKRKRGDYVVIWKYKGGERAYPVTVK